MVLQRFVFFSAFISFLDGPTKGIMTMGARMNARVTTDGDALKDKIIAGEATAADILNSATFVDHSMFIEYFLRPTTPPHLIITAPRKFGKTFNLDLLRLFLGIETAGDGQPIAKESTEKYRQFSTKDLKINKYKNGQFFQDNFASRPILYLDFKKIVISDSVDRFVLSFALMIRSLFVEHNYVIKNKPETDKTFKIFMRCSSLSLNLRDPRNIELLMESCRHLTNFMRAHFKRPCIVLIDNYDLPVTDALFNEILLEKKKRKGIKRGVELIIDSLGCFLSSLLEDNPSVERILLTGTTWHGRTYANREWTDNLHSIRVLDDPEISQFYGFSRKEVEHLAEKFNRKDDIYKIEYRYKGHRVNTKGSELVYSYCPLSVIAYLMNRVNDQYWTEVYLGQLNPIFDYEKMGPIIEELLEVTSRIEFGVLSEEYYDVLVEFVSGRQNSANYDPKGFGFVLQYLSEQGVFSATTEKYTSTLNIATMDVRELVEKRLYSVRYLKSRYNVTSENINNFIGSLKNLSRVMTKKIHSSHGDAVTVPSGTLKDLWNVTRFYNLSRSVFDIYNKTKPSSERMMHSHLIYPISVHGGFTERHFEYVRIGIPIRLSSPKKGFINFMIITKKMEAAIVVVLKYGDDETSHSAINDIIRYTFTEYNTKFRLYDIGFYGSDIHYFSCQTKIYIGVNLRKNGNLTISYLYNTLNLENAIDVSFQITK